MGKVFEIIVVMIISLLVLLAAGVMFDRFMTNNAKEPVKNDSSLLFHMHKLDTSILIHEERLDSIDRFHESFKRKND